MDVVWFTEISKKDVPLVGEKAAYLAELYRSEYPVPPGFIITNSAFLKFLHETNIINYITTLIQNTDLDNQNSLLNTSSKIQDLILESKFPEKLQSEIIESYESLDVSLKLLKSASHQALNILKASQEQPFVAVRLSPEIKIETISYLNITGKESLIKTIKRCWAFLFTPDILKRTKGNIRSSIIIQKMIDSNKSGVIETYDNEIKIKACLGLNESKMISFDNYIVDRSNFEISSKNVSKQDFCILRDINLGKSVKRTLFDDEAKSQKLDDAEIRRLAKLCTLIEEILNSHVLVDFGIERGKLYFLQATPLKKERIKEPPKLHKVEVPTESSLETVTQIRIYASNIEQNIMENCDGIGLLTCNKEDLIKLAPLSNNKSAWFLSNNLEEEMPFVKECHDSGFNNMGIILPMINSIDQLRKAKDTIKKFDLEPLEEIEFGITIETPASVQIIEEIAQEYVDFVSIGIDNLTKFTLTTQETDNIRINPAVLRQIKHVISICKDNNIEVCVHGSILENPDIAEFLVRLGADSLIINPSKLEDMRKIVEKAERKMLLEAARKSAEV